MKSNRVEPGFRGTARIPVRLSFRWDEHRTGPETAVPTRPPSSDQASLRLLGEQAFLRAAGALLVSGNWTAWTFVSGAWRERPRRLVKRLGVTGDRSLHEGEYASTSGMALCGTRRRRWQTPGRRLDEPNLSGWAAPSPRLAPSGSGTRGSSARWIPCPRTDGGGRRCWSSSPGLGLALDSLEGRHERTHAPAEAPLPDPDEPPSGGRDSAGRVPRLWFSIGDEVGLPSKAQRGSQAGRV